MRKILNALIFKSFLCASLNLIAQIPSIEWAKSYGGSLVDEDYCVHQTTDGGYIMAGSTDSNDSDVTGLHSNSGNDDYWIVKTDSMGNIQWQKCLGGTGGDDASSIALVPDGGYAVVGTTNSTDGDVTFAGNNGLACWVTKLSSSGNLQWEKCYGYPGTSENIGNCIQSTSDGGFVIAATSYDTLDSITRGRIIKIDSAGSILWQNLYGINASAQCVQQTMDLGYIVCGTTSDTVIGNNGGIDCWILKTDSSGLMQWQRHYGSSHTDDCYSIVQTRDSGYIFISQPVADDSDVNCTGFRDYWLVKLDPSGHIEWKQCYGGSGYDKGYTVKQTSDNGFVIAGSSTSNDGDVTGNHGSLDYWIVKTDSMGTLQWQKSLGGSTLDAARSVEETRDGGYVIAGYARSSNGDVTDHRGLSSIEDFWLVKLAPLGLVVPDDEQKEFTVYPNPARESLQLAIGNPGSHQEQKARIRILNLVGEEEMQGIIETQNTTIDIRSLASGMYFITLQTEEGAATRKFVKECEESREY